MLTYKLLKFEQNRIKMKWMKNIYYEKFKFGGTDMSNLRLNKITLLLLLILVLSLKSVEGSKAIEVFNNESVEESGNFVFKELD